MREASADIQTNLIAREMTEIDGCKIRIAVPEKVAIVRTSEDRGRECRGFAGEAGAACHVSAPASTCLVVHDRVYTEAPQMHVAVRCPNGAQYIFGNPVAIEFILN